MKDTQINVRRHFEAERQRHHGEVEGVDAVDLFERVRVVSPHVGLVGFLGRLVEIVVLFDQLLQLKDKKKQSGGRLNLNLLLNNTHRRVGRLTCDWMSEILLQENSNSLSGTWKKTVEHKHRHKVNRTWLISGIKEHGAG